MWYSVDLSGQIDAYVTYYSTILNRKEFKVLYQTNYMTLFVLAVLYACYTQKEGDKV